MRYKVGDKVRVRQWGDMLEEFGKHIYGIDTPKRLFAEDMRVYCGKIVTIKK